MPDHPAEVSDDEVIVTYTCPKCVKYHPRDSYTDVGSMKMNGIVHRIYECPARQRVILDMQVEFRAGEPVFIDLDPQDLRT